MNIVYCFNDNYDIEDKEQISYLFVSLISLLKNNKNSNLNIYIIYLNFNKDNLKLFNSYFKEHLDKIHLIKFPTKYKKKLDELMLNSFKTNPGTFLRLFIGDLLPKNINFILYLDTDTIINKSIKEIFKLKNKNKKVMAVGEFIHFQKEREKKYNLKKNSYFNAGVLLLNLTLIREELSSYALEIFKEYGNQSFYADQDALNIMYNNSSKLISNKYNYMINRKFSKHAVIYHYAGKRNIIKNKYCLIEDEYKELFWYNYDMTPWMNQRPKTKLIKLFYLVIFKALPRPLFLKLKNFITYNNK